MLEYGDIKSCKLELNLDLTSKCYGYVSYFDNTSCQRALKELDNKLIKGQKIQVCALIPNSDKDINNVIYIKHLPTLNFCEEDAKNLFSKFGIINSLSLIKDANNKNTGVAIIGYKDPRSAAACVLEYNNNPTSFSNELPLYVTFFEKKHTKKAINNNANNLNLITNTFSNYRKVLFAKLVNAKIKQTEDEFLKNINLFIKVVMLSDYTPLSITLNIEKLSALITFRKEIDVVFFMKNYSNMNNPEFFFYYVDQNYLHNSNIFNNEENKNNINDLNYQILGNKFNNMNYNQNNKINTKYDNFNNIQNNNNNFLHKSDINYANAINYNPIKKIEKDSINNIYYNKYSQLYNNNTDDKGDVNNIDKNNQLLKSCNNANLFNNIQNYNSNNYIQKNYNDFYNNNNFERPETVNIKQKIYNNGNNYHNNINANDINKIMPNYNQKINNSILLNNSYGKNNYTERNNFNSYKLRVEKFDNDELSSEIFDVVYNIYPDLASKIAGMIIDLGDSKMKQLLLDRSSLNELIKDAFNVRQISYYIYYKISFWHQIIKFKITFSTFKCDKHFFKKNKKNLMLILLI